MAFTLTDPRAQAISQAGVKFGGALGDALSQYIQNRQFGKAMEGLNPNSPIQDVLQRFAQNNVSPELQQRYFSSPVQQALQRERGKQDIKNLSQADFSNLTPLQAVIKAMELTQNAPPGTLETFLPAFTQAQQNERFRNLYGGKQAPTFNQKPMQPSTEQRGQSTEGYSPEYNAPAQFEQPLQAPQQTTAAPFIRGRKPGQQETNAGRGFQQNLTFEDSIANAYEKGAQSIDQAIQWAQLEQETQKQRKELELKDENDLLGRFDEEFKGNLPQWFRKFATEDFRYQTGTSNERAEKTLQNVRRVKTALDGAQTKNIRGFWDALRRNDIDGFYDRVGNSLRNVFQSTEIPEAMKAGLIDEARASLAARGDVKSVGIAEIMQRQVNPDYKKDISIIDKIPKMPEPRPSEAATLAIREQKLNEKLEKNRPQIVNALVKILSNPYSSPLAIKSRLLEKGYPDNWIRDRFDEAQQQGWNPSRYQIPEIKDVGLETYQNVENILQGQPSLIGIPAQISGTR